LQDIFFCFLFQPYPLAPLPIIGCMGVLCEFEWIPPAKTLGILGIFLNGSIVIYLSLLLRIQQAMIIGHSRAKLSRRSQFILLFVLAACAFWVVFSHFCTAAEHPDRSRIIEEHNVSWLEQYTTHVIVLGAGIGDAGSVRLAMLKLAVFDVFWYTTAIVLIFLILRELKRHAKFESAQKRLCRTAQALLSEVVAIVFLSFYPPLFLPDLFYFSARILFVVCFDKKYFIKLKFQLCFSIQSIASSLIFLSYHQFGR
ncbi:hypothetical protein PMAYCL1PPCAC_31359, partial [Pristionchus mayeri]